MDSTNFFVLKKRNLWFFVSIMIIVLGFSSAFKNFFQDQPAFNYGIDFVGGFSLILKIDKLDKKIESLKPRLQKASEIKTTFIKDIRKELINNNIRKNVVQITQNNEVIIKISKSNSSIGSKIVSILEKNFGNIEILEMDFIGPTIGEELRKMAALSSLAVSFILLIYITWRFKFSFGIGAVIALFHDALLTLSISILLNLEINTSFIAALLTILGYSINDTIVVFDRIRYVSSKNPDASFGSIIETSIKSTLVRTLNTSLTTLIVVLSLIIFGGTTIRGFCTVLFIGFIVGTYSSIFIASPVVYLLQKPESQKNT